MIPPSKSILAYVIKNAYVRTLIGRQVAGAICATVLGSSNQTARRRDKVCIFRATSRVDEIIFKLFFLHTAGGDDHREIGGGKEMSPPAQYQGLQNIYLHTFPI